MAVSTVLVKAPRASRRTLAPAALLALLVALPAHADDATQWLARVAQAARSHNYVGTIVYQRGNRVETSRIVHLNQGGMEYEKLSSLDGPAREVVRGRGEVRFFYPDAKFVRVEPRTFRNAFPSLSPEQQKSLKEYYDFKIVAGERVGGVAADIVVFEPKDGLRYGHRFWSDATTGLLLKARVVNERGEVVEQFAFTDIQVNAKVDKSMVEPSWPAVPPDWTIKELSAGDVALHETGWVVTRIPAGFTKIMEGFRKLRGRQNPVAHLVFSDGLVAISVFVEPIASAPAPTGMQTAQGGLNMYSVRQDDHLVTVMGEAPGATVRQIGNSVAHR
ncbi:MAG: MucB/RseB C-terminal domain-containing protein [Betaproteobacteria bacterium]